MMDEAPMGPAHMKLELADEFGDGDPVALDGRSDRRDIRLEDIGRALDRRGRVPVDHPAAALGPGKRDFEGQHGIEIGPDGEERSRASGASSGAWNGVKDMARPQGSWLRRSMAIR